MRPRSVCVWRSRARSVSCPEPQREAPPRSVDLFRARNAMRALARSPAFPRRTMLARYPPLWDVRRLGRQCPLNVDSRRRPRLECANSGHCGWLREPRRSPHNEDASLQSVGPSPAEALSDGRFEVPIWRFCRLSFEPTHDARVVAGGHVKSHPGRSFEMRSKDGARREHNAFALSGFREREGVPRCLAAAPK